MKIQVACNILDTYLHEHDADMLTREAFTALSAYAKGLETKRNNAAEKTSVLNEQKEPKDTVELPVTDFPRTGGGSPWSKREDNLLKAEFYSGMSAKSMAQRHERTIEAIAARLVRLGCLNSREELPGYLDYRNAIARRR